MAVTIDTRPTYFGDRMIVTGSYEAGDTSIVLTGLLASIDAVILNPTTPNTAQFGQVDTDAGGSTMASVTVASMDIPTFTGSTITIASPVTGETPTGGTFLAIGRRS
jgi:hypothetical protein